jgi:hypothetical protein
MSYKKISSDINIIFNFFYSRLNNINIYNIYKNEEIINNTFIFILNVLYLLNKLIILLENFIIKHNLYKKQYNEKIDNILKNINSSNVNIINLYNNFIDKNEKKNDNNTKKNNQILNHDKNKTINLNLVSINNLLENMDNNNSILTFDKDNYIKYDYVDLGFNNLYKLHIFKKLNDTIPFNLLVYVIELDQIVIKVGDDKKYRFINSKIYKTYDIKINNDNSRSILCNNNINELHKKCNNYNCNYYHDYILGYPDNYHIDRQFSNNPIVFNCPNFKDGSKIKYNANNIEWYHSINLYQFNLSCLLLGCIHSLYK